MLIPMSKPNINRMDLRHVKKAVNSGWVSSIGPSLNIVELNLSNEIGNRFVSTTSNGTTALHLALLALKIGSGDEVIVPNLSFVAVINSVLYTGATPVVADIDSQNLGLNFENIEKLISKKTKAVISVHNYGIYADTFDLASKLQGSGIYLIEDCAEALFLDTPHGRVGTFGDISVFSFYGNKLVTSGEGGAIATKSKEIIDRVNFLKNQGALPDKKFYFPELAYNYRMTNIQAALLISQLKRKQKFIERRYEIFDRYLANFHEFSKVKPLYRLGVHTYSPWLFSISIGKSSKELIKHLLNKGIDSRPFFTPYSKTPRFSKYTINSTYEVSEVISDECVSLPTYYNLKNYQIDKVCNEVMNFFTANPS